ncbi:MarR family winged helix-turn-helix transcriptional regulator [Paenibacillus senegalensis]|uniref:MarR family winged helix-turn-helix transcriptional regulator n=1 Tax=Paenibacillus senegalensis TaxID=1465766 RepID=UPI000289F54D|nr:MarR family transcriptional regulator [Paenibacillus senegalensis]
MGSAADNPAVEQLIRAFLKFREVDWLHHAETGHKHSEIKVLLCIYREEKEGRPYMRVSQISRKLRVTAPTVTQLLNSLEDRELIERISDETDRRTVLVKLTSQGKAVIEASRREFYRLFSGLAEYLGEEESRQLAELLAKAYQYLSENPGGSGPSPKNGVERHC